MAGVEGQRVQLLSDIVVVGHLTPFAVIIRILSCFRHPGARVRSSIRHHAHACCFDGLLRVTELSGQDTVLVLELAHTPSHRVQVFAAWHTAASSVCACYPSLKTCRTRRQDPVTPRLASIT